MLTPTIKPLTAQLQSSTIEKITKAYPHINSNIIGKSHLRRPIHALTIGHGKKNILINAAHHANEWITSVIALYFLEECAYYTNWQKHTTLHIVPMVNPDGVDVVTGGLDIHSKLIWEANCKMHEIDTHTQNWKANIVGTDLNSNYPAGWEHAKKRKFDLGFISPSPRDYVGKHPLSEPESRALAAYTYLNDFDYTISLHTQGEEIFWQYENFDPPHAKELATRLSIASGYKLEDVPEESSHAGYRDWFISKFNRPGITVECGIGENPLPLSQLGDIYKKTAPLLWEAVEFSI